MSEPYAEEKQGKYRKAVHEELIAAGHPPPKVIPTFKSEEEKREFILKSQPQSTQEAIARQKTRKPQEDLEYLLRPMPACIANPDAKTQDELTGMRALKPDEISAHNRTKSGRNQLGSSKVSSIEDKRDRGIQAFTYSKPYDATLEEIKKLKKIEEIEAVTPDFAPKEPEVKESLTFRIASWLQEKTGVWWW